MLNLHRFIKIAYVCAGGLCSLALVTSAFADSCDNLDSNNTWNATFEKLNEAYVRQDYATALQYSRELENICELSPILNYTIAYIHKGLGNSEKYLFYLQKSTQNTERFSVDKNALDQIWNDKYVAEHPDASPESIENYKKTIESLKAELEQAKLVNTDLSHSTISKDQHLQDKIDDYKTPMWIAAGIGIGGLAMAGAGAALVAISDSIKVDPKPAVPPKYKDNAIHTTGWILVGVGSGLAISGAIFTGIFGYKYRHFNDTKSLSINLSPSYTSLSFQF
ncbi:MAG: hypothetical protein J6A01_06145 [Proteobacteria bacterium]|nr:hypothetical protein [Pseudomonadota bacterium]